MILSAFTVFHVVLSLVGIGSGLVVLYGLLTSKPLDGWTKIFLTTTVATSVTGFLFPFHGFTPAVGVGKVPALNAIAPTQSEPPFQITQLAALILFVVLGVRAVMKFRAEPRRMAAKA
jgi:hypothetical protein